MENENQSVSAPLTLRILSQSGNVRNIGCDSVSLCVEDDSKGRFGGRVGIHRGHADALIALTDAPIIAYFGGEVIAEIRIEGGFASISHDVITVF